MSRFPDWKAIFPADDYPLALTDDSDFQWANPTTVRGLFLSLAEIANALPSRQAPDGTLAVFADVLRIEAPIPFALPSVRIHARRIECCSAARLGMGPAASAEKPACSIEVYADEWAFEAGMECLTVEIAEQTYSATELLNGGGVRLEVDENENVSILEFANAPRGDCTTGQLVSATAKELAYETNRQPPADLALLIAMLRWVAATGGDPLLQTDARSLVSQLAGPRSKAYPVPVLRLDQYKKLAEDTRDALGQVESLRSGLLDRQLSLEDQRRAASNMLSHYESEKSQSERLIEQAKENLDEARTAQDKSKDKLDACQDDLAGRQKAFEEGIDEYKAKKTREAIFGAVKALAMIGGGIALACTGNPAGAAAAASGTAQVAKAAGDAAEELSRLAQLIKSIGEFLEAMTKLKKYMDAVTAVYNSIGDPLAARGRAGDIDVPEVPEGTEMLSAADWDEMLQTIEYSFSLALKEGIGGAEDYLVSLKKLAIRGRDYVNTTDAANRACQALQRQLWQSLRVEEDIDTLRQEINNISEMRRPGYNLFMYYRKLNDDLKFRFIHAIEDLRDALRFVALTQPPSPPAFSSNGAKLAAKISDLQQSLLDAKEKRGSKQTWGPEEVQCSDQFVARFTMHRSASWEIGFEEFEHLEFIRISSVRIWLNGATVPAGEALHIGIQTSGHYLDRLGEDRFEFSTRPMERIFRYEFEERGSLWDPWDHPVTITLDGDDAKSDYFEPTPFTTWQISFPRSANRSVDLSTLSAVAIEFRGTAKGARLRAVDGSLGAAPSKLIRKVTEL